MKKTYGVTSFIISTCIYLFCIAFFTQAAFLLFEIQKRVQARADGYLHNHLFLVVLVFLFYLGFVAVVFNLVNYLTRFYHFVKLDNGKIVFSSVNPFRSPSEIYTDEIQEMELATGKTKFKLIYRGPANKIIIRTALGQTEVPLTIAILGLRNLYDDLKAMNFPITLSGPMVKIYSVDKKKLRKTIIATAVIIYGVLAVTGVWEIRTVAKHFARHHYSR